LRLKIARTPQSGAGAEIRYPAILMFDEPQEEPVERSSDPASRAKEKAVELCMRVELFAVFEGCRKFDARIIPGLDLNIARDVQRGMARLEKTKTPDSPVLPETAGADAAGILNLPVTAGLSTNDYHIHRRPGEVMIIRWLSGDEVDSYYTRIQAHFDAAMNGYRDELRTDNAWKQDPGTTAYLTALDAIEIKLVERYLREPIRQLKLAVLSTQTIDELNVNYLANYIMNVDAAEIVGEKSAPSEEPSERELAWFFKLFSLRGINEGVEQMCYFTFLQKSDDEFDFG
jgi:hypothetical protein